MLKLPKPQLVVFDLDNTLYDYEKPNKVAFQTLVSAICSYNKVGHNSAVNALTIGRERVKKRLGNTASSHSRLLYIAETYRILEIKPQVEEFLHLNNLFWDTFLYEMDLFPGVRVLIEKFKIERIPLALVTDLTSDIQYRKLVKLGLTDFFDSIVTSEDAGGDKVSGLPFKLLEETFTSSSSNTWYFGDSIFDTPSQDLHKSVFFRKVESVPAKFDQREIQYDNYLELLRVLTWID